MIQLVHSDPQSNDLSTEVTRLTLGSAGADTRANAAKQWLEQAKEQHRRGELSSAVGLYHKVLECDPHCADAHHLLGFAAFQTADLVAARRWIEAALDLRPGDGEFHTNLALVHLCEGNCELAAQQAALGFAAGYTGLSSFVQVGLDLLQREEFLSAQTCFELALQQCPGSADAMHYLGLAHKKQGRIDNAIECYEAALREQPDYVEALVNLGNAWRDQNDPHRAIPFYESAISWSPGFASAHNNLGVAQFNCGDAELALRSFTEACRLDPGSADALNNLGNALRDVGRLDEATSCLERALRVTPNSPEILNNLGTTLRCADKTDEAIHCFEQALAQRASEQKVIRNLAAALADVGRFEEARAHYESAVRYDPEDRLAQLRSEILCPIVFQDARSMEKRLSDSTNLLAQFEHCQLPQDVGELAFAAGPPPFSWQFFAQNIKDAKAAYAKVFAQLSERLTPLPRPERTRTPYVIGITVTHRHEGIFLKSLRGILERMDRAKFRLVVFASRAALPRLANELSNEVCELVGLPAQLEQAAERIRHEQLDLLYYWEIGTDSTNYFLPFFRLAPVQCTSWGIQVTSGIPAVDYYLSSHLVEPADAPQHYTEQLALADTLLCFRERLRQSEHRNPRRRFGFDDQQTIYLCAQQVGKFHPDFDRTIRRILQNNQSARLVLTANQHGHVAQALRQRLAISLPDVFDRVVFLPRQDASAYAALIQASDVLLDPPHFVGVNTTYDGLSFGKPIVTCPSSFHRGRYTLGCYRKIGVDSCVAADESEYVDLACRLGSDRDFRQAVQTQLLDRGELLFEDHGSVAAHESMFASLIQQQVN